MIIQVRNDTIYYYDVVVCSSSNVTSGALYVSLKASIFLVFYSLQFVVVAVIVDWDGLPVCCDVC